MRSISVETVQSDLKTRFACSVQSDNTMASAASLCYVLSLCRLFLDRFGSRLLGQLQKVCLRYNLEFDSWFSFFVSLGDVLRENKNSCLGLNFRVCILTFFNLCYILVKIFLFYFGFILLWDWPIWLYQYSNLSWQLTYCIV